MEIVYHRTRAQKPATYPIEVHRFTVSSDEVPVDKATMAQYCEEGCPSYDRNGACPPFSPDFQVLSRQYRLATVVYIKLEAAFYPVRMVKGRPRTSWKYTESFLPAFLRRQVLQTSRQLNGFPLTAGHCTGCRPCGFAGDAKYCLKPESRTYSLGGCGVKVAELMEQYSDSPLLWWNPAEKDKPPPYQLRVGMVLHN